MLRRFSPALLFLLSFILVPSVAQAHGGFLGIRHLEHDQHGDIIEHSSSTRIAQRPLAAAATIAGGLPTTWCGTETASDDVVDAVAPSMPQVKVLYIHPNDRASRFTDLQDRMQADVSAMSAYVAQESGYRKTIRFDLGTSCGPQYVDIQSVTLPHALAYYLGSDGKPDYSTIEADTPHPGPKGSSDVVIADYLAGTNSGPWGLGGGVTAFAFLSDGPLPQSGYYATAGFLFPGLTLHEIGHTLGAVDPDAPHGTPGYHCTDQYDVMCYNDGSLRADQSMSVACPAAPISADANPISSTLFDCGKDDYFNPSPAPGSFLATHPEDNTYRSTRMTACTAMNIRCAGQSVALPDADSDGFSDDEDDCPTVAGVATRAGCPNPTNQIIRWKLQWKQKALGIVAPLVWDANDSVTVTIPALTIRTTAGWYKIRECAVTSGRGSECETQYLKASKKRKTLKIPKWIATPSAGSTAQYSTRVYQQQRNSRYKRIASGYSPSITIPTVHPIVD